MSYEDDDNKFSGFKTGYKYKIGTKEYIDLVYKNYGLLPYEYMKPEKISDFNNPIIIKALAQYNKIKSGRFMLEKNHKYKDNYIDMMENMGIEDELIEIIRNMSLRKFIGSSDILPYMRDYYSWLKGRKIENWKDKNAGDVISDFRDNLIASLKELREIE